MPVFIDEVVAEVIPVPQPESEPGEDRAPVPESEFDVVQLLSLLEERRLRLAVD